MNGHIESPFLRPVQMMAKPAGAACNLQCRYCYYIDRVPAVRMDDAMLEQYIREYIAAMPVEDVMFIWHGGEPLLRDIGFYRRALELQQRYAGGHRIDNSIQTNGTLITDEWAQFFHDNGFLVGVSIDGPAKWHDRYRTGHGERPTHAAVTRGIECLNRHSVEWNAMAVVNDLNVEHPLEFYRYFRDGLGCRFLQFTPVFEQTRWSVTAEAWGRFLCEMFDEWARNDIGNMFVQIFESTLANHAGVSPGDCTLARECGGAPVIEANGDVYTCDHFVEPRHLLGNIHHTPLATLLNDGRLRAFGEMKRTMLPRVCRECEYLRICNGECPRNRVLATPDGTLDSTPDATPDASPDSATDGTPGLNYLCEGYKAYFRHTAPYMRRMAAQWHAGLPIDLS